MTWNTYILLCSDDSFYVGHTHDLKQRLKAHNAGKGAQHTRHRRPVTLVYSEDHHTQTDAMARELQLKKWSRAKKQALINHDISKLRKLAQRRTP